MQIDLTKLTPGQIALMTVIGTVIAAVLAGTFGLVVALINAWSANCLARSSARRQFRLQQFEPFLKSLDSEIRCARDVLIRMTDPGVHGLIEMEAHVTALRGRAQTFREATAWSLVPRHTRTSQAIASVTGNSQALDAMLSEVEPHLRRSINSSADFFAETGFDKKRFMKPISTFVADAMLARTEIEYYIFQ